MRTPLVMSLVALISSAAIAVAASGKIRRTPDVMVVADAVSNLPEQFKPSTAKPIYYALAGGGQMTLGEVVAGIKMPNASYLYEAAGLALESQGYLRAKEGDVPALVIRLYWGDANFSVPSDFSQISSPPRFPIRDIWIHRYLLGWHKREALSLAERNRFGHTVQDDVLFVLLAAFAAQGEAKRSPLWTTSMTIDGRTNLREGLPVMLASAAPYFGRDATKPSFIGDRDRRATNVQIGTPTVVAYDVPTQGAADDKERRELRDAIMVWRPKARQ